MKAGSITNWLIGKYVDRQRKRQAEADADTINNLARLYQLKKDGVLTAEEFAELKPRLKILFPAPVSCGRKLVLQTRL